MAYTSGRGNGYTNDGGRVYVQWQLASQSQAGNYSTINWQFGWQFISSPLNRSLLDGWAYLSGTRYDNPGKMYDYVAGNWSPRDKQIASGTFDIGHNSSGYCNLEVAGEMTGADGHPSSFYGLIFDLPRIPKAPSTPAAPNLSVDGNSITVSWNPPSDDGGTAVTSYTVERASDAGFTTGVVATSGIVGTSTVLSNLSWGAPYYVRVKATNGVGTSGVSAATNTTTGITVPNAPSQPAVSGITPIRADVAYAAPTFIGGSAVTGYDLQRARDSGFTNDVVTTADNGSPFTWTGLQPGTDYYTRVRAKNGAGNGAWSTARQFKTLPGAYIGNGSAWQNALVWVGNGSQWVLAQVKSGNGTTWK